MPQIIQIIEVDKKDKCKFEDIELKEFFLFSYDQKKEPSGKNTAEGFELYVKSKLSIDDKIVATNLFTGMVSTIPSNFDVYRCNVKLTANPTSYTHKGIVTFSG